MVGQHKLPPAGAVHTLTPVGALVPHILAVLAVMVRSMAVFAWLTGL